MKNKVISVLITISIFVVFIGAKQVDAELNRNLRIGMSGEDVRELQVFLNTDPETRIASSGVGSPGKETNYFGTLTYQAVKKFQTKYAYDVLIPIGLSYATGYVGTYTLAKIARLEISSVVQTSPNQTSVVSAQNPKITAISPLVVEASSGQITLTGENFSSSNTIITSGGPESGVLASSNDGKSLTFQFTFPTADKMKSQMSQYRWSAKYQETLEAFLNNLTGEEIVRYEGNVYARVIIVVKNSNGQSTPTALFVDLRKVITN